MRLLSGELIGHVRENDSHANRSKARKIADFIENTESKTANNASNSDPSASNGDDSQSKSDDSTGIAIRFSVSTPRFSGLVMKQPMIAIRFTDYANDRRRFRFVVR